jgi:hypothetical protein
VLHGTTESPEEPNSKKGLPLNTPTPNLKLSNAGQVQKVSRKKGNPSKGRARNSTIVPPLPSPRQRTTPSPRVAISSILFKLTSLAPNRPLTTGAPRRQEIIYPDLGGFLQFSASLPNITFGKPPSGMLKGDIAYPSFTRPKERPKANKNRQGTALSSVMRSSSSGRPKGLDLRADPLQKNAPGKGI